MNKLTNIERLKLELANKNYFTDDEYSVFLDENSLNATEIYEKQKDELYLLQTVISIFSALSNNIDLFIKTQTEFLTISSAQKGISDRIGELERRILLIPSYEPTNKVISYLFHN